MLTQILKVNANERDGDECGHEWDAYYLLYEDDGEDEKVLGFEPLAPYAVYRDDGAGNGSEVCRGWNVNDMRHMVLALGTFVEWKTAQAA